MTDDEFNSLGELPDLLSHLQAVVGLSSAISDWNKQFSKRADEASEYAMRPDADMDAVIAAYDDFGYAEMAKSLSIITTTAAFLESTFKLCLPKMEFCFDGNLQLNHPRVLNVPKFWDPREPKRDGTGIAQRITDTLEAAQLLKYFGQDLPLRMTAVFSYRNAMIHGGFEWDVRDREKFATRIKSEGWDSWFSISTIDDKPWYFTMTGQFQRDCLDLCHRAVYAFEGLIWQDWDRYEEMFRPNA